MTITTHDGVGIWMTSIQEWGEFSGIRIGTLKKGASQPEWSFISHGESDGVGALARFLRSSGFSNASELPKLQKMESLGKLGHFKQSLRYLFESFKPKRRPEFKSDMKAYSTPTQFISWRVLDESATRRLTELADSSGVSLNSWLLSRLNDATCSEFKKPDAALDWLVPVNMRGAIEMSRDTDNHASFVELKPRGGETPKEVHARIRHALASGQHWFMWYFFQITSAILSRKWRLRLIDLQSLVNRTWTGSFSNLGSWTVENAKDMDILFCPPVIRFLPLGAGVVMINRRLSFCIQIHSSVDRGQEIADSLMRNWISRT